MCMMPRAAPCECVCAHCAHRWAACVSPSSRRTTVELNMKVSIIYTWLVKTLHNVLFSFCTFSCSLLAHLLVLACFVHWLRCFLFLIVANRWLRSALDSAKHVYLAEDRPCCPPRPPLSWSAFPASTIDLHRQCMWRMSSCSTVSTWFLKQSLRTV